jgi:hypothetical protein
MIIEIEIIGGPIIVSSSDLLWVSKDVVINKGVSYFEDPQKLTGVFFWWVATFSVCIFGKDPILCSYLTIKNGTKEDAIASEKYQKAVNQHEALLKALGEK